MSKPLYYIRDWSLHFENSESRKVKRMSWLPIPNKHDGKSYRRMTRHPRAAEIFAAWVLILQIASKTPTRGVLADQDGVLTSQDMSDMTGMPQEIFDLALNFLSEPQIGWIYIKKDENIPAHPDALGEPEEISRYRTGSRGSTGQDITGEGGEDIPPTPPLAFEQTTTPEGEEGNADARKRMLALLTRYGSTLQMAGKEIFHEWVGAGHGIEIAFIELIFEREKTPPRLPSELRNLIKRKKQNGDYELWLKKKAKATA